MAKAKPIVPCQKSSRCCLLDSHNDSCVMWRVVASVRQGWDIVLFAPDGTVLDVLEVEDEPGEENVRAAAHFIRGTGKLPAKLMKHLPTLTSTVYDDRTLNEEDEDA